MYSYREQTDSTLTFCVYISWADWQQANLLLITSSFNYSILHGIHYSKSSLLECDTKSSGKWILIFLRIPRLPPSGSSDTSCLSAFPWREHILDLQKLAHCSPKNTTITYRRTELSAKLLAKRRTRNFCSQSKSCGFHSGLLYICNVTIYSPTKIKLPLP